MKSHNQPTHFGLPVVAEGRPKRISKAPPCGTGGHKHGHNVGPEASDEGHTRPPPHYTRRLKIQKGNSKLNVKQHTLFPMVFLFSHFNLGADLEEL